MTIYFVAGYRIMEIVETTGGIVIKGGDSWWSSMLKESADGYRCW